MYPWIIWEPAADPGTHSRNHWRRKVQQETARGDQHLGDAFQQLSLRMLTTKRVGGSPLCHRNACTGSRKEDAELDTTVLNDLGLSPVFQE